LQEVNDKFVLELSYTPLLPGAYLMQIGLRDVGIDLPEQPQGVCYEGNIETLNSRIVYQENVFNEIEELSEGNYSADVNFGFIVE